MHKAFFLYICAKDLIFNILETNNMLQECTLCPHSKASNTPLVPGPQVLDVIHMVLHGLGPYYIKDCLSMTATGALQPPVPVPRVLDMDGRDFTADGPLLQDSWAEEVRMSPSLTPVSITACTFPNGLDGYVYTPPAEFATSSRIPWLSPRCGFNAVWPIDNTGLTHTAFKPLHFKDHLKVSCSVPRPHRYGGAGKAHNPSRQRHNTSEALPCTSRG